MAKKKIKIPSSKNGQPQKQQLPNSNEQKSPTNKNQKKSISGIVLSVVTLSSLIIFWPRLSVDSGETLDPSNPFMSSFIITNDGYGFCYPVKYSLSMKNMRLKNNITFAGGGVSGFGEDIPMLCPNDKTTISLQKTYSMPPGFVEYAEIYIDLSYAPTWIPSWFAHIFTDIYRFQANRKENGTYFWQRLFKDK